MYDAVEDAFVSCDYDIQVDFQLESFLFGCGINICPVLLNMTSVKYIYFLNCKWMATTTLLNFKLLAKQKLCEIHLISTHLPEKLMKVLCSGLLDTGNSVISSLFIYNPKLSDQDSDKLCHKFVLSDKVVDRVNLIVSNTKIQGIVNTSAIREQLTKLELLNILANINRKCSDQMQTLPWKGNLYYDGSSSDLISFTFIKMLHKITCSKWNWQLRIILREKDVLIAHKVNYRYISEKITVDQPPKAIFLSDCNITGVEHLLLYDTKATLTNLCILNSYIDESWFTRLNINLVLCKEIFIHTLYHINIDGLGSFRKNSSTVLVTKTMILGCNPSTEQMALALQLEPSIDVFKLSKCQRDFDCFRQFVTLLTTNQINWTKLDLVNCYLGEIECEILWNNLKINKDSLSTVQTLKVSSKQLTIPLVADFIKIVLMWKVQQLIFCGINHTVYEYFVTKFKNFCCMNAATNDHDLEEVFLSVTYSSKKNIYFCNCSWNHITGLLESCTGTTLNIFNCCFPMQAKIVNISELSCITKLHIINSNLHENTIVNILETFVKRKVEISIFNISINVHGKALYNFITSKKFVYRSRLNVVVSMKSFMCGYSTTEDQLYLLQSQKLSDLEESVVALLSDTKSIYDKELFVFQNNQLIALHLVGKVAQEGFLTELTSVLKGTSNLRQLTFSGYNINANTVNDVGTVINSNTQLQKFDINKNNLKSMDAIKIAKVLQNITTLTNLCINNNCITDKAANDIAAILSCNIQMQELDIGNNRLQAVGIIKIAKALQTISTLEKLCISNNAVTNEAACDIAAAICNNNELQEFDVSNNNLYSTGAIKIARALQDISTLTKLYINNNHITDKAADYIAAALSCNAQLQKLDVSENCFETVGIVKILKALQNITTLKKLCINKNNITDEAAQDVAAVIYSSNKLRELDVSKNNLSSTGAIKIAKALQTIATLKKLCISSNNIGDEAAGDIATALCFNIQLQELDINETALKTKGIATITKALQNHFTLTKLYISNGNIIDGALNDIAVVLYQNIQLQKLDIGFNQFSLVGIKYITNILCNMTNLRILRIKGSSRLRITDEVADNIAVAISCNTKLQLFDSRKIFSTRGVKRIVKAL